MINCASTIVQNSRNGIYHASTMRCYVTSTRNHNYPCSSTRPVVHRIDVRCLTYVRTRLIDEDDRSIYYVRTYLQYTSTIRFLTTSPPVLSRV